MHGVLNHALRHVVRVARGCYRALVAFGALWLPLPEDQLRRILYGEAGETAEHGPRTEEQGPETGSGSGTTATAVATAPTPPTGRTPPTGPHRDSTGNPAGDRAEDRVTRPAAARTPARRTTGGTAGRPARRLGTPPGPPPGHPERLCVDVPLSELERGLARQLKGV
ncbi:DUF6059 family protein [Streptomyces narbonensis]|uniref:DUF6059 family protein n=1 Tax=Streptomyces narbonensis TaxID=67333 RepID=UPI0016730103|nr:DUF6059 family protein [Streptomyces narbonensis]GGV94153.1 hypothetical protein GCM10010230_07010 [Streptomyces narbonensis]